MNLDKLKEFENNKTEFIRKHKKNIPEHILLAMLLNTAISFNLIKLTEEILTMIEIDFIQHIHVIFTINDYTGFNVLTNLLITGSTELLGQIIRIIKKINYQIKKIKLSELDLQNFDTFLRCLLFNDTEVNLSYLIDNLVKPFYTEESVGELLSLITN